MMKNKQTKLEKTHVANAEAGCQLNAPENLNIM